MDKLFIGPDEVLKYTPREEKTPLGMPIYSVELSSGRTLNLTKKMFDHSTSTAPSDLTALYHKRGTPFVHEMEILIDEWGIADDDFTPLMKWVERVIDLKREDATNAAYGLKDISEWSLVNYHLTSLKHKPADGETK